MCDLLIFLQALLTSANGTSDYDALAAVEQIADYLLSPIGEPLLEALTLELIEEMDSLGAESAAYIYSLALKAAVAGPLGEVTGARSVYKGK